MSEVPLYHMIQKHNQTSRYSRNSACLLLDRCRANMAQSRPDSGPGFQVKVLNTFEVAVSSPGSVLYDRDSTRSGTATALRFCKVAESYCTGVSRP